MHILYVIGGSGDQAAHRVAGEKCGGQILDMAKQTDAQIVHNHMTGILHDHFLDEI